MSSPCYYCNGSGWIVMCIDDICQGLGECIHGDGEEVCPECLGRGGISDDPYTDGEWEEDVRDALEDHNAELYERGGDV